MYKAILEMKFKRGFWLGYAVGAADAVIVWSLWSWRAELLTWLVG